MAKSVTPKPVVVKTICSMCGLDWDAHGDSPTTEDCIRLLKAEIDKKPSGCTHYHYDWWYRYGWTPNTTPYVYPQITWTSGANTGTTAIYQSNSLSNTLNDGHSVTVNYSTPAISSATLSSTSV